MNRTKNWLAVWERKGRNGTSMPTLAMPDLLSIDGFNTEFGTITEDAWETFVGGVFSTLGAEPASSVFEVGCGGGAFLVPRYRNGAEIGGIDFSDSLVKVARAVMPGAQIEVANAIDLRGTDSYDYVVSCSTFLYFPDLAYASEVLTRMAMLSRRGIALLDLPDAAREAEDLAFRTAEYGDPEAYARRYAGLTRQYFDRNWCHVALREAGASRVEIVDQDIAGYGNASLRFNAFAWFDDEATT